MTLGFFGALFLVLFTLKVLDYVDWSWWWVTAPLWGVSLVAFLATVGGLVTMVLLDLAGPSRARRAGAREARRRR